MALLTQNCSKLKPTCSTFPQLEEMASKTSWPLMSSLDTEFCAAMPLISFILDKQEQTWTFQQRRDKSYEEVLWGSTVLWGVRVTRCPRDTSYWGRFGFPRPSAITFNSGRSPAAPQFQYVISSELTQQYGHCQLNRERLRTQHCPQVVLTPSAPLAGKSRLFPN